MVCLADGFRNVEATGETQKFIRCLVAIDELSDFRVYKEASIDGLGLAANAQVADVACGLGFDLLRLCRRAPAGLVVGFDASSLILDNARRSVAGCGNVLLVAADARELPCSDALFDAVRIDRTLQHLADPRAVVAEMARATRRGGVVAASEPDWTTFSLGSDDDPAVQSIVAQWFRGFRNPRIGAELPELFKACGLGVRAQLVHETTLTDWASAIQVYDVEETIRRCVAERLFDEETGTRVTATFVKQSQLGQFRARLVINTVIAAKR